MKILITGTSGFIGFHTAKNLLEKGEKIIGFDNENDYYDVNLKFARRNLLEKYQNFKFYKGSLENLEDIKDVFKKEKPNKVLNLVAQAGVRYSLINPYSFIQTNIVGFHNIIELSKQYGIQNFVYASSASVYGNNKKFPFSVIDKTDEPLSLYGATKKANELIAHSYSIYFGLPTIGLRFFNVYGPWGRPDGVFFIFIKRILEGQTLDVYNKGNTIRNFTYIDDVIDGIVKALDYKTNYDIFNLGNTNTVVLNYMIECIEKECGIKGNKNYLPADIADIPESRVDIDKTKKLLKWKPKVYIEKGIKNFVKWYKEFYKINNIMV